MPRSTAQFLLLTLVGCFGITGGCSGNTPPSNPTAPLGAPAKTDTKVLEKGAEALQDLQPIRSLDFYLDGFHVMKNDPGLKMEAHHFCKGMNEEFTQCVIFDGNTVNANIIGVEYIISERLFATLDRAEQKNWHPHNYEILSGQLVMPGLPDSVEKIALKKKLNSYGKTWHIWDTGHVGHPASNNLPIGEPRLAWSFNRDGEAPDSLVEERDRRMKIHSDEKRTERQDLVTSAKPQQGVDDMAVALHGAKEPPAGVQQAK